MQMGGIGVMGLIGLIGVIGVIGVIGIGHVHAGHVANPPPGQMFVHVMDTGHVHAGHVANPPPTQMLAHVGHSHAGQVANPPPIQMLVHVGHSHAGQVAKPPPIQMLVQTSWMVVAGAERVAACVLVEPDDDDSSVVAAPAWPEAVDDCFVPPSPSPWPVPPGSSPPLHATAAHMRPTHVIDTKQHFENIVFPLLFPWPGGSLPRRAFAATAVAPWISEPPKLGDGAEQFVL